MILLYYYFSCVIDAKPNIIHLFIYHILNINKRSFFWFVKVLQPESWNFMFLINHLKVFDTLMLKFSCVLFWNFIIIDFGQGNSSLDVRSPANRVFHFSFDCKLFVSFHHFVEQLFTSMGVLDSNSPNVHHQLRVTTHNLSVLRRKINEKKLCKDVGWVNPALFLEV